MEAKPSKQPGTRTIVPPKPTVRPSGLNVRRRVGALRFPGAAALARDTEGPTNNVIEILIKC